MSSGFNSKHVKVLLRKDYLTLKRNWMFFLTFIILPIAVMSGFNFLESLVEGELAPERHNLVRKSTSH
jgi:ABC-type Na+ efflux pump permease subunit